MPHPSDTDVEKEALYSEAMLAQDVKEFFKSPLGKVVLGYAKQDIDQAIEDFRRCNPNDNNQIAEIHYKMRCAEGALQWLREIEERGVQAFNQLEVMEMEGG